MEIRINNEIVETRIENEKNAFDVMQQVNNWLLGEGYFISSVLVNGIASSPSEEENLSRIAIDSIDMMEINALPLDELSFESYATLLNFFFMLHQSLTKKDYTVLADLLKEMPHILTNMDGILTLRVGSRPASEVLEQLLEESGILQGSFSATERLAEYIKNLCIYIEGRIREIANPLLELRSTAEHLKAQIPKLEEVPVLLQTGQEHEAMQMVIAFTELGEKLNRLYPLLSRKDEGNLLNRTIGDMTLQQFYEELNGHLQELTEAIEAEDSILIGDLLEYEIAPKIAALVDAIDKLPAFAGTTR